MRTNTHTQRVLDQIDERIKEAFLATQTFDEVDNLQNHFSDYIATGIKKMVESKVWTQDEIDEVESYADSLLETWVASSKTKITTIARENWEF